MDYRLLGPVEVRQEGNVTPLGGPRQQAVLSALLFRANSVSSMSYLTEAVWEKPPTAPESNLRTYISALRRCLRHPSAPDDRVETRLGGYLLRVQSGELDAATFDDLVAGRTAAHEREDAEVVADRIGRALALWRGRPLEGLAIGPGLQVEVSRVMERRIEAEQRYARAMDELGRSGEVADRLRALVNEYPLREELWTTLIWALYRSDRRAEALHTYRQARTRLVEELGIEPGPTLRRLQQRLLTTDAAQGKRLTTVAKDISARRQLPMEISEFINRETELRMLDSIGDQAGGTRDSAERPVLIVTIEGMAGVGKTRLAVQAGRRLVRRGRFDEVQLWADLHGFDPDRPPVAATDVLDYFLRTLGIPPDQVPVDLDARCALYRDRLAGMRALVVLDNAVSEDQVSPLLPGEGGSLVLVTSRRSLAALPGAVPLALGVFSPEQARALLGRIAGHGRIAAEPEAADEIAARCGYLPIALRLAARQLCSRPTWSLAELSRRLESRWRPAGRFADQSLSRIFDVSYRALPTEQRRMFRLLGVYPGDEYTAMSAALLAGISVGQAEFLLEYLLDEHLVEQHAPGRYRLHELLRSYARACAEAEEPARTARREAVGTATGWVRRPAPPGPVGPRC
jgi:DNA-binding SARP family transcriptional activator